MALHFFPSVLPASSPPRLSLNVHTYRYKEKEKQTLKDMNVTDFYTSSRRLPKSTNMTLLVSRRRASTYSIDFQKEIY